LGFVVNEIKTEGRPAFNPKVFLKIYLYGYLNGLRSSRKLEKECKRNVELQWLICKLVPNYALNRNIFFIVRFLFKYISRFFLLFLIYG